MIPVDALAAPIRALLDSVGTGSASVTDPTVSVREVTAELERTDARLRHALDAALEDWESTAGDDAQTTLRRHRSQTRHAGEDGRTLTSVIEDAARSVRRAAVELRGILDSFVHAADAMGPALYTPTGVAMILPVAATHLQRALAVVERTRAELDAQSRRLLSIGRTVAPGTAHGVAAAVGDAARTPTKRPIATGGARTRSASVGPAAHDRPDAAASRSGGPPTPGAVPITLPDGSVAYAPNQRAATAVRAALGQRGVPYVWGGTTPGRGLDCSALTQYAYRQAGVELPRLAQDQDTAGYRVDRGELLPGDLAVWSGHVAMYVGNDQMVEADRVGGCQYVGVMRAVIYTRVSDDNSGRSTSTDDQERECRAICAQRGWDVAETLCDSDIGASRWSGKDRPAYRRLAEVLRRGDVLVTWEASRAQRDLAAYVQLRDLCSERGVQWCYSGRLYDLTDGDDRFGTGLDALLAEKEAEQIRSRVLRGKRSAAMTGRPGGRPPYGYRVQRDPDTGRTINWIPDPDTAPIVVEAISRALAGESLFAVARDFTSRGIPAPSRSGRPRPGGEWVPVRMRVMLLSPSYAGLRVHQGSVIGPATWEPLVAEDDHQRLRAVLTDPGRVQYFGSVTAKHLLTGIAVCGVCGEAVRYFHPKSATSAAYMCSGRSCVKRRADLVETLVVETMLARLESINPREFVTESPSTTDALREARELRARLDEFADRAAEGELSAASLGRIEAKLLPQIAAAERRASVSHHPVIGRAAGPDARATWEAMDILDRRNLIRGVMTVTIMKATGGTRRFVPDDVSITWRL